MREIKKLSVVISCFNEEDNIKRFSEDLIPEIESLKIPFELILVDDGSTDNSAELLRSLMRRFSTVVAGFHPKNSGLGAGLRTGFSIASGDVIATLDADLTFHPRDLRILIESYLAGGQIVMGSPFVGQMEGVHFIRKMLSWCVNRCYKFLLKKEFTSTSSIFRLYEASFLKQLPLVCTSFDINAEILFRAIQRDAWVKEVGVSLGRRQYGVSKISVAREIRNHLRMFYRIFTWRYLG